MHGRLILVLLAALVVGGYPLCVKAQTVTLKRQLAKGVDLWQEITPDGDPNGPLIVTIIRVNPKEKGVRVEAALGQDIVWGTDATQGREIVSTLAARRKAVAGVNAGFFPFAGNPIGLHIENGDLVTEPSDNRSCFGITEKGEPYFGSFGFKASLNPEGTSDQGAAITGLNRPFEKAQPNELIVFTPKFGPKTLPVPTTLPGAESVVLEGIKPPLRPNTDIVGVVKVASQVGGNIPIGPNQLILAARGTAAEWLRQNAPIGKKLRLRFDLLPPQTFRGTLPAFRTMIAGGPRLVTDGKVDIPLAAERMGVSFSETRHPRTAIGQTRDGRLLFVTVDGRQKGLSRGISLDDLAKLFLRYDAVQAVNMDGGGSSACVVRDGIANSPSEGRERPVANAYLIFADDLKGETSIPKDLLIPVPTGVLKVGEAFQFTLPSKFAKGSSVERIIWSTRGGVGFVSQDGLFRALRPGQGEVRVSFGGRDVFSIPLRVVAAETAP